MANVGSGGGRPPEDDPGATASTERPYLLERVDEAAVAQLYADGFGDLSLREKTLVWHLYQAAIAGRDIFYDQRYAHSLEMRDVLECVIRHPAGVDPSTLDEIRRYTKLFWINTGPYNNLTARKFVLRCAPEQLAAAVHTAVSAGARPPVRHGETVDGMLARMAPWFFDETVDTMITRKTPPAGGDILAASANNLYVGVTMADLRGFTETYPLNSRLVKEDGRLVEQPYRVGGLYSKPITAVVLALEAAVPYATAPMAQALRALIASYRTGSKEDRRTYDIAWVQDTASPVDTINGFTEMYLDARGIKGAWGALVFYVNEGKTAEIRRLAASAQWFEDRMPWDPQYRKPGVRGISASAIDVVVETGDAGPMTPLGINLPNDEEIRQHYGSKSVSLSNVSVAYEMSTLPAYRREFSWTPEEAERSARWGALAGEVSTYLHEVIGHASGRLDPRLTQTPQEAIKENFSALEEARADLVALYFLPDPKLAELGLLPAADHAEVARAEYERYTRNALAQLRRVRQGTELEEDHMRNRQLIVRWLMANTDAVDLRVRGGKTFYVMTDAAAFRQGVGRLLSDVQRIKAQGDYAAARNLFEAYGIHFDPALRDEVVARVDALGLPSYTGFVMPKLEAVRGPAGDIVDVRISYPRDLTAQMLEYADATRALR